MKHSSNLDAGMVVNAAEPTDSSHEEQAIVPAEYLRAVSKAVKYLATYSAAPPNLAAESFEDRQRYMLGYALPFLRASVPAEVLWRLGPDGQGGAPGEALVRWTEDHKYYPRSPGELLEVARAVLKDRSPGWKPQQALEGPAISRAEWIRRSNETRRRMGLDLLPEEDKGG